MEAYCSRSLAKITASSASFSLIPFKEMCCFLILTNTASRLADVVSTNSLTSSGEWERTSATSLAMKLPVCVSVSWST